MNLVPAIDLIPAIDLLDGKVVRLLHGDFDQVTCYPLEPKRLALRYAAEGANWLHVVDLAASRDGAEADTTALFELLGAATQNVQTGGGVRKESDVTERLQAGASRVVIGSLCVTETPSVVKWLDRIGPESLVAALDISKDDAGVPWPRIHGWTRQSDRNLWQLMDELCAAGLKHLLCTDIARDGALSGPNLELYTEITQRYPGIQLQASGGVSSLADLESLKSTGATGVISGKALLDERFSVPEALQVLQ